MIKNISSIFSIILFSLIANTSCTHDQVHTNTAGCSVELGYCYSPPDKSKIKPEYNHPRLDKLKELEPEIRAIIGYHENHAVFTCDAYIISIINQQLMPQILATDPKIKRFGCLDYTSGENYILDQVNQMSEIAKNNPEGEASRRLFYTYGFLQEYSTMLFDEVLQEVRRNNSILVVIGVDGIRLYR